MKLKLNPCSASICLIFAGLLVTLEFRVSLPQPCQILLHSSILHWQLLPFAWKYVGSFFAVFWFTFRVLSCSLYNHLPILWFSVVHCGNRASPPSSVSSSPMLQLFHLLAEFSCPSSQLLAAAQLHLLVWVVAGVPACLKSPSYWCLLLQDIHLKKMINLCKHIYTYIYSYI